MTLHASPVQTDTGGGKAPGAERHKADTRSALRVKLVANQGLEPRTCGL